MDNQKKIGEKIKIARVTAGMTQESFGKKIGFSAMGVSYLENGLRELKIKDIEKIAEVLNVNLSDLLLLAPATPQAAFNMRHDNDVSEEQMNEERKSLDEFENFLTKGGK